MQDDVTTVKHRGQVGVIETVSIRDQSDLQDGRALSVELDGAEDIGVEVPRSLAAWDYINGQGERKAGGRQAGMVITRLVVERALEDVRPGFCACGHPKRRAHQQLALVNRNRRIEKGELFRATFGVRDRA